MKWEEVFVWGVVALVFYEAFQKLSGGTSLSTLGQEAQNNDLINGVSGQLGALSTLALPYVPTSAANSISLATQANYPQPTANTLSLNDSNSAVYTGGF